MKGMLSENEHPFHINYGVELNRKMFGENTQVVTNGIEIMNSTFQLITLREVETPGGFICGSPLGFSDKKVPTSLRNPGFNMLQ